MSANYLLTPHDVDNIRIPADYHRDTIVEIVRIHNSMSISSFLKRNNLIRLKNHDLAIS